MVTLPSLVRMVWVVIVFEGTPAESELFARVGHHRYSLTFLIEQLKGL